LETIRARRSIRQFTDQEVSRETIEQIVDAGRLAASGRNAQPWEFVVVTDRAMRRRLADAATSGKFLAEVPVCIVVICEDGDHYLEDGSAASQNMLVAATGLGLGSCWVAGDNKPYGEQVLRLIGASGKFKLVSLIAIGYQKGPTPVRKKRPLDKVLHWEKF